MGFDEEWAKARADAADEPGVSMRLNRVDDGPVVGVSGVTPDQASTPASKKAAANTIQTELEPGTAKAAVWADTATDTAVTQFAGWDTAAGLKTVRKTWDSQVATLMKRLASEKDALRGTAKSFSEYELDRQHRFGSLG